MKHLVISLTIGAAAVLPSIASGETLEVQAVTDGIWAIVGEKEQRSPENLGNNATFGLVVTSEGAVLVDPGGSWKGAAALDAVIRGVTDQPVKYVINTGGQDHRWLGNGYWQAQGAQVIASADAVADQQARGSMQMTMLTQLLGAELEGTEPVQADITFDDAYTLDLGGTVFEITHPGDPATTAEWTPSPYRTLSPAFASSASIFV